jgi:hypothetical protein
MLSRRDFLISGASLTSIGLSQLSALAGQRRTDGWNGGGVVHLLPTVSHDRLLIKVSLRDAHRQAPVLLVASRKVPGRPGDTLGRFWGFDAAGLEPGRRYQLQLLDARGAALCDPWPLSMFPAPADTRRASAAHLLIRGHDVLPDQPDGESANTGS